MAATLDRVDDDDRRLLRRLAGPVTPIWSLPSSSGSAW
jgi:hypothetical protein